jgi:hypothetical protein
VWSLSRWIGVDSWLIVMSSLSGGYIIYQRRRMSTVSSRFNKWGRSSSVRDLSSGNYVCEWRNALSGLSSRLIPGSGRPAGVQALSCRYPSIFDRRHLL